jgi:uncharacterized protein
MSRFFNVIVALGLATASFAAPQSAKAQDVAATKAFYAGVRAYEAKDFIKVVDEFTIACDGKVIDACANLGILFFGAGSSGFSTDFERAAHFNEKGCSGGKMESCKYLAWSYWKGQGRSIDLARAAPLLEKACGAQDLEACNGLGGFYLSGSGVNADYGRAITIWSDTCNSGYGKSCYNLGQVHSEKTDIIVHPALLLKMSEDFVKAAAYYDSGCKLEYARSCHNLAVLYAKGKGVKKDTAKAIVLWEATLRIAPEMDMARRNIERVKAGLPAA